jgi:hypothetical protein
MHLVETFLPADPRLSSKRRALCRELAERFGGLTAFTRAPAKGLFADAGQQIEDDIVILEIMTDVLEDAWWTALRVRLEDDFQQEQILIRAAGVKKL